MSQGRRRLWLGWLHRYVQGLVDQAPRSTTREPQRVETAESQEEVTDTHRDYERGRSDRVSPCNDLDASHVSEENSLGADRRESKNDRRSRREVRGERVL